MNYFDLINKCLVELNYKKVRAFSELVKNDHEKIKNILNIINSEICCGENWKFLLRKDCLTLEAGCNELENTINGKINTLIIDNVKYSFCFDFERFILGNPQVNTYSSFNNKLLLPTFDADKSIEIVYYTNNFAKDNTDNDKSTMVEESDSSVIPEPFVEPILVYGTCMRMKANPEYSKFNYWYGMYNDTHARMRANIGTSVQDVPTIILERT